MARQSKRTFLKSLGLMVLSAVFPAKAFGSNAHHVVVLGDLHLPGNNLETKKQVLETINGWSDAEMVVALGDLCEESGAAEEYAVIKAFFSALRKPLFPVVGNHDFIYSWFRKGTKSVRADVPTRDEKLGRFKQTFGLDEVYYSKTVGDYCLVFLSTDSPGYLAELSARQLGWLRSELARNRERPTIVFFHAPLAGTLRSYNHRVNTENFVAQPAGEVRDLLAANPQVFLWVSGHTHTSPREESFASAINVFDNRVTNIHNTDMQDRDTVWTNSLFLFPDRVVVKTFDHRKGGWLPAFERDIRAPRA